MISTHSKAVVSILFSTLVFASSWSFAAGEPTTALQGQADKVRCADNSGKCRVSATATEVAQAFIRHARQDACPEDAPDCAARAKFKRNLADDQVRDRHACRD